MALETAQQGHGRLVIDITGQATHAAGESVGHIVNPEGVSIAITSCIVHNITNSTGAANLTIGQGATVTAAHDSATIYTAAALAASAGTVTEGLAHGDPADALPIVTGAQFITACTSADSSGYTGRAFIDYIILGDQS